jgi:hypothetical protein
MRVSVHTENEDSTQGKTQPTPTLSRNLRIAVPLGSILILLLFAMTISLPGDVTHLFVPVYIFVVVIYVITSIQLFKTLMDKETPGE